MGNKLRCAVVFGIIACFSAPAELSSAPAAPLAQPPSPKEQLGETIAGVLSTVRDPSQDAKAKEARVKEILASRIDYEKSSAMALGRHVRANRGRMGEFASLFRTLLEKAYLDKLIGAAGEVRVSLLDERLDGDYATVGAMVTLKPHEFKVLFRLHKTERGWMVYDIVVEGISMLANYRSQFNRLFSKHSFDEVLRRLKETVYK